MEDLKTLQILAKLSINRYSDEHADEQLLDVPAPMVIKFRIANQQFCNTLAISTID